jgi:hypothetical protein
MVLIRGVQLKAVGSSVIICCNIIQLGCLFHLQSSSSKLLSELMANIESYLQQFEEDLKHRGQRKSNIALHLKLFCLTFQTVQITTLLFISSNTLKHVLR